MDNSTGNDTQTGGEVVGHASAEEFLMIMVHYSWITVLVIFLLGACSFFAYRKQPSTRRTSEQGLQVRVHHSPGILAHGGYPWFVRGAIGTVFFTLAVLPLFLIFCSTMIGLILAVVEKWEAGIGVEYLLSNVLGMTAPLTNVVPEDTFGIHFAIIMNMYAVVMVTTAMGLVANMALMQAVTEKVPQSTCGFLAFLLFVVPLFMFVTTGIIGCIMALCEGWTAEQGYFFMAASMASLANPVTDVEPETAFGSFFECLCLAVELCIGGCVLGLVASHPVTTRLCEWLEGSSLTSGTKQDLVGYSPPELKRKLDSLTSLLTEQKLTDTDLLQKQIDELATELEQDDAEAHINRIFGDICKLEDSMRSLIQDNCVDPRVELEELRAKVAELEAQLKDRKVAAVEVQVR